MSRTHKSNLTKGSKPKFEDGRTGWYGENCWNSKARRWIARIVAKHNRRVGKKQIQQEI